MRYKLFSAASAIAMAMAIGGAQAAELLANEQLDTIAAGAASTTSGATNVATAGSDLASVAGTNCGSCNAFTSAPDAVVVNGNNSGAFAGNAID